MDTTSLMVLPIDLYHSGVKKAQSIFPSFFHHFSSFFDVSCLQLFSLFSCFPGFKRLWVDIFMPLADQSAGFINHLVVHMYRKQPSFPDVW